MINIVTINYKLNGDHVTNTTISGNETLLDADLVIYNSFGINEHMNLNRQGSSLPLSYAKPFAARYEEMNTLLKNGKIIIAFLSPVNVLFVDRKPITSYDPLTINVNFLTENLKSGKGNSNAISLGNQKSPIASYFNAFKNELEYSAYLDINPNYEDPFFILNRSNRPVAFSIKRENGIIIFLPPPKYNVDNPKLLGVLIGLAKKFFGSNEITQPPDWVSSFTLNGEESINAKIHELTRNINVLTETKQSAEKELESITKFKALLYEQGPQLEAIVIEAFNVLGFQAQNRKLQDLEHDVVFESSEGRGIAEVEGKDNDLINIQKFDQLNRAVDEDFELTGNYPQGVLIGNHYRLTEPSLRKEPFSEKVHIVAKKKTFGLLTTIELYHAVQRVLQNPNDEVYKSECRSKILNTTGEIIKL